jgi:hypothetical protein
MAVPNYIRERIFEIRTRANAALQLAEARAVADMGRFIDDALRLLGEAIDSGQVTGADSVLAALELVVDQIAAHGADVTRALAGDVFDTSLSSQFEVLNEFAELSPRQLASAANTFRADFRDDLLTRGHRDWYERMSGTLNAPDSALRRALIESEAFGEDVTSVAKRLVRSGGVDELPDDINLDAMRRAKRFIRTESTRVDTATSVGFAESVGVARFLNVGVGDERQSDICAFASEQRAMTLDEWNRLRFRGQTVGAPPRHPHCRCGFMGVFEGFKPGAQLLEEAGVVVDAEGNFVE